MAIIEVGIIVDGIPIVTVQYYESAGKTNKFLTSGLLEAIQSFAQEIFNDETDSFRMKRYTIFLHKALLKSKQKMTIYAICNSKERSRNIHDMMRKIASKFLSSFHEVNTSSQERYQFFAEIITKTFGDLIYHPADRLRSIFPTG